MKKLLVFIATSLSLTLSSQDYNLQKGTEIERRSKIDGTEEFAFDASNIYRMEFTYQGKGTQHYLSKTKINDATPLYNIQVPLESDERHEASILAKNNIWIFSKKYDPSLKEMSLLVRQYDANTGAEKGSVRKISSLESDALGNKGRNFYIKLSPDESKLMIVSEFQWKKKAQNVTIDVYEAVDLKKISTCKTLDTFNTILIENFDYLVDNAGGVSYLFKYVVTREQQKTGIGIGKTIAAKSMVLELTTDRDIELGETKLELTENNNLIVGGIFYDKLSDAERDADKEAKAGIFAYFVNGADLSLMEKNLDYFNTDVYTKLTYVSGTIRKKPGQKYYKYYGTQTVKGSTFILFTHRNWTDQGQSIEREIVVAKYTQGKQDWLNIIPRPFSSNGSFTRIFTGNGAYLFYDDKKECFDANTINSYDAKCYDYTIKFKPTIAVYTFIDNDGNMTRKEMKEQTPNWYISKSLYNELYHKPNALYIRMINPKNMYVRYDLLEVK